MDILGNTELAFEIEAPDSAISNFTSKLKFCLSWIRIFEWLLVLRYEDQKKNLRLY